MSDQPFGNLISVCYPNGGCGSAIAYLLSLSPESWQDWDTNPRYSRVVSDRGGVHDMLPTRLGLIVDGEWVPHDYVKVLLGNGIDHWPDASVPQSILEFYRSKQDGVHCGTPLQNLLDVQPGSYTINATHATSYQMRLLYPGTKTVSVLGPIELMMRNFYHKELSTITAGGDTYVDDSITRHGGIPSHSLRKRWLHLAMSKIKRICDLHADDESSFRLNFVDLFGIHSSHRTYHAMVEYCGMTPDWPRASRFIDHYRTLQPSRPFWHEH